MKTLLVRLFGKRERLSLLEKLVLNAVRERLDTSMSMLWDSQVATINKVQRLPDGVEVNFYRTQKSGKASSDPAIAFPNKAEELLVAKVELSILGAPQRLVAQVWAVRGYIFSIEYTGGSRYFEEALGMYPAPRFEMTYGLLADLSEVTEA